MRVDDVVGLSFPKVEFVPEERMSVAHFARVIGSPDRRLYSTEAARRAGLAARPVPAAMLTFVNTIGEDDLTGSLGITYGRTLFAGYTLTFGDVVTECDVVVGQTRVARAAVERARSGRLRQILELETAFQRPGGTPVATMRATFMEKVDRADGVVAAPAAEPPGGSVAAPAAAPSPHVAQAGGDRVPARSIGPLSTLDFARFSIATDDPNLVHVDDTVARGAGLPSVIGSGGIPAALATDLVASWAPSAEMRTARVRMVRPITPGVVLTAEGRAVSTPGGRTVAVRITEHHGELVTSADFELSP